VQGEGLELTGALDVNAVRSEVLRDSIGLLTRLEQDIRSQDGKNALRIAIGLLRAKRDLYKEDGKDAESAGES
jgi:hypothetical protein